MMESHDVYVAVYWTVFRAVYPAGGRARGRAVSLDVYRAVNQGVDGALSQSKKPPHPGLGLYLKGVG